MNIVLYTKQLEPLTIFNLPIEWIEFGRRNRFVAVAIPPKLADFAHSITDELPQNYTKQVRLTFERLRMGDVEADIVMVDDDVTALLLPPGWLPGQQADLNEIRKRTQALERWLLRAFNTIIELRDQLD